MINYMVINLINLKNLTYLKKKYLIIYNGK